MFSALQLRWRELSIAGSSKMIENHALGIGTFLEVVVGPLVLAMALAFAIYRYRHGPIGTTSRTTPRGITVAVLLALFAFCVIIVVGSGVLTRGIENTAKTTGSSTRPADPGGPMDRVNQEHSREKTNGR
jgi:hypothetical protein